MSVYLIDVDEESRKVLDLIRGGMHPSEAVALSRDEAITLIREALKRRSGKPWSVTGGRGTAWGWITITAPPARRVAHDLNPAYHRDDPEPGAPSYFENPDAPKERRYYMSEAECVELGELLSLGRPAHCQGVSIAADSSYRIEYTARALGLEPISYGEQYWD